MSKKYSILKNIFGWTGKFTKREYFLYGLSPVILLLSVLFYFLILNDIDRFFGIFMILAVLLLFIYFSSSLKRWRDIGADKITISFFIITPLIATFLESFEIITIDDLVKILLIIPINFLLLIFLPSCSINGYKGIVLFVFSFIIAYLVIPYLIF